MSTGLLSSNLYQQGKLCPNDRNHGAMEKQPGVWAIDQVAYNPSGTGWDRTGTFYASNLFRCKTCGLIQLYDQT